MMTFFVNYPQFKYTDQSDNPPLRTWKIKAPSCEAAFTQAQVRAVLARQSGRKVGGVRIMGDMTKEYAREVLRKFNVHFTEPK